MGGVLTHLVDTSPQAASRQLHLVHLAALTSFLGLVGCGAKGRSPSAAFTGHVHRSDVLQASLHVLSTLQTSELSDGEHESIAANLLANTGTAVWTPRVAQLLALLQEGPTWCHAAVVKLVCRLAKAAPADVLYPYVARQLAGVGAGVGA